MKCSKPYMRWGWLAALSALCLLLAYPLVLFTAGPLGAWIVILYAVSAIVLTVLFFKSPSARATIPKRALIVVWLIPLILLAVMLVLVNTAWFHLPG